MNMRDPFELNRETLSKRALLESADAAPTALEIGLIEAAITRVGRAVPKVLLLGRRAVRLAADVDRLGGMALCMDIAPVSGAARSVLADARALPFKRDLFDICLVGRLFSYVPGADRERVALSLRDHLRPGGLLVVTADPDGEPGIVETDYGDVWRSPVVVDDFAELLNTLDFDLLEADPAGQMTFRREY